MIPFLVLIGFFLLTVCSYGFSDCVGEVVLHGSLGDAAVPTNYI